MPKPKYGIHPGVAMVQNWKATLEEKTGRGFEQWVAFARKSKIRDEIQLRDWLCTNYGFNVYSATMLVERVKTGKADLDTPASYLEAAERYVDEMFAGGKAGLRPAYDALLQLGYSMGKDVKACPCRTIVPLYRKHVFAQIKPSTRKRIDMGFALGALPAEGRLIDTGGYAKKDRITHRIPITSVADIDDEVRHWMKTAYNLDK